MNEGISNVRILIVDDEPAMHESYRQVFGARSGGNVDIVRDGTTGLLYETASIDGLRDRIAAILNGEFTPASPAEIRESVRGWAASEMAAKYNQLYEQLAKPADDAP